MYDWLKSTAALAAQAPWWPPSAASGYHADNHGHLIGEVLHRVTGMSLKELVRNEIAAPLDADFQIGARPEDFDRIAEIIPPPPLELPLDQLPEDSPMRKTWSSPAQRRGGEHRGLASRRPRRAQRPRQCALAGAYALRNCFGRHGKWCKAAAA
jgi:CubicO group peptidase (beta-lactamase class C family)